MKLVFAASAALLTFAGLGITAHADTTVAPPPIMTQLLDPPPPVTATVSLDPTCISDIIAVDACYVCLNTTAAVQAPVVGDVIDSLANGKRVCPPPIIHP